MPKKNDILRVVMLLMIGNQLLLLYETFEDHINQTLIYIYRSTNKINLLTKKNLISPLPIFMQD